MSCMLHTKTTLAQSPSTIIIRASNLVNVWMSHFLWRGRFCMECKWEKYTTSFNAPHAVSQSFHPRLPSRKGKNKLVNLLEWDYMSNSAQVIYQYQASTGIPSRVSCSASLYKQRLRNRIRKVILRWLQCILNERFRSIYFRQWFSLLLNSFSLWTSDCCQFSTTFRTSFHSILYSEKHFTKCRKHKRKQNKESKMFCKS